jgi:class 3 adenylate cyclase
VPGSSVTAAETSPSLAAIIAQVDPALPDFRHRTSPDGMMTIVFTDIEGSTELMERLGEDPWLELMLRHNKLVRSVVASYDGDVVKSQGDGFMLVFGSAAAALSCVVELQRAMTRLSATDRTRSLHIRIGVHTGNVFHAEHDFFGRAVILAARITAQARGGEVLISASCKEYTERLERWSYGEPALVSLKGLAEAQCLYPLEWQA